MTNERMTKSLRTATGGATDERAWRIEDGTWLEWQGPYPARVHPASGRKDAAMPEGGHAPAKGGPGVFPYRSRRFEVCFGLYR